jgi:predicted aconitase with swiveling domain
MNKNYKVRKIVRGSAVGEAIVCPGGFSFLGDVDMTTGEIIAADNPNKGLFLKNNILIYKETKGSSGGMSVLMTLNINKNAPAAIISVKPVDYNLTEGAILSAIPFVCEPDGDILSEIKTGDRIKVNSDDKYIEVISNF